MILWNFRKIKKMRFCLIALLLTSNTALAQIWSYVITSNARTVYFIDPASVTKQDGVATYTQLLNYPDGYDSKNPEIHSIKHTKQIDCLNNISRTLTMIAYNKEDAKGDIQTLSVGQETRWLKINQNSILSLYKNEVCV